MRQRLRPGSGSIPAPAGEPSKGCTKCMECGSIPAPAGELTATSPRLQRSIPAPAGDAVYPRACGGNRQDVRLDMAWGLSPRLRGNQLNPPAGRVRTLSPFLSLWSIRAQGSPVRPFRDLASTRRAALELVLYGAQLALELVLHRLMLQVATLSAGTPPHTADAGG